MYYLVDMCFLCLKSNVKLQSLLIQDIDGIVANEKIRCIFPELINSTPDAHKLACLECLEKLRIPNDFKQLVNNTVFKDYIDKLQCQHKSHQQLQVVLTRLKRQSILAYSREFTAKKDEDNDEKYDTNSLKIEDENLNFTSTNLPDQSNQVTRNENDAFFKKFNCQTTETNLKIENIEIVDPLTEEIEIKEEPFVDDAFSTNYLDEQIKTHDQSHQLTTNENTKLSSQAKETNLKTEDIEVVNPLPEAIYIKQEPFVDDDFTESTSTSSDIVYNDLPIQEGTKKRAYKDCTRSGDLEGQRLIHSGENPFQCQICHKTFTDAYNLNIHKLIHTGEKPHQCDVCNKRFRQKGHLMKHKRSHNNIRPYQCSECSKAFTQSSSLTTHMRLHTGETPYECHICQFKSSDSGNLKNHIRTHTGEKPYICTMCNKSFTENGNLTRHMRTHTGEKPYECRMCHFKCANYGTLKSHVSTHSNEKPFQCEHCKKSFKTSNNLNVHLRKLHN